MSELASPVFVDSHGQSASRINTRLDHALALAAENLSVLPIQPGCKTPYPRESWAAIKTTEVPTIRGWFEERPNMNYAICPGKHGVIIDLDEDETKGTHGVAS